MPSILTDYYPYRPSISQSGEIDPSSMHGKKAEVVLTLALTALASTLLYHKTSRNWTLLGAAFCACVTYQTISSLGDSIPKDLADQTCLQAFLSPNLISENIVKRVLSNEVLRATIFKRILSTKRVEARMPLLDNYFRSLWQYALPSVQKELLKEAVIESSTVLFPFIQIGESCLNHLTGDEELGLWMTAKNGLVVSKLSKLFDINKKYNGKTLIETCLSLIILNQSDKNLFQPLITNMKIFFDHGALEPNVVSQYQITAHSTLFYFLQQSSPDKAVTFLKKFL